MLTELCHEVPEPLGLVGLAPLGCGACPIAPRSFRGVLGSSPSDTPYTRCHFSPSQKGKPCFHRCLQLSTVHNNRGRTVASMESGCGCQALSARLARRASSLTQTASCSQRCALAPLRHHRSKPRAGHALRCAAGMGIGFQDASEAEEAQRPELLLAESGIRVPKAAYGLSMNQIAALGLAGGEMALKLGEPSPVRFGAVHSPLQKFQTAGAVLCTAVTLCDLNGLHCVCVFVSAVVGKSI